MINLDEITRQMAEIAGEAGAFIKKESPGFDIRKAEKKGFNDFVSYVDKGSEKIIVDMLKRVIPDAGFVTEEGTVNKSDSEYCWVIDPLDGTTNFLHGLPPYAVSIGLLKDDIEIAGAVYEICLDEMFTGWKEGGAWLNGKRIHVSDAGTLAESLVATGFPYTNFSRMNDYMDCFNYFCKHTHGVRRLGSAATDIVYIACGRFEVFYEYGLHPWDIAAAINILREAGGKVSDFSGNENSLKGEEIVAANGAVYNEALEIISKFMNGNQI